ncbi:hypothetical protein POTOM_050517 [Populus tomentosa]|uniref:K Homology domain-containing protein n=1 Tax=Populus tomentosa TaxID=118781 RepID=A0A8X7Y7R6_POPTO|nr:hypothetical protein POTOM_050517 [Populus tomentosa]
MLLGTGRCSALCSSCEGKSWKVMLSSPTCPVLEALGKKLSFEIAVGFNGRVWVKADSPSTVIVVVNAIVKSESLSGAQQKIMAEKLLQKIQMIKLRILIESLQVLLSVSICNCGYDEALNLIETG